MKKRKKITTPRSRRERRRSSCPATTPRATSAAPASPRPAAGPCPRAEGARRAWGSRPVFFFWRRKGKGREEKGSVRKGRKEEKEEKEGRGRKRMMRASSDDNCRRQKRKTVTRQTRLPPHLFPRLRHRPLRVPPLRLRRGPVRRLPGRRRRRRQRPRPEAPAREPPQPGQRRVVSQELGGLVDRGVPGVGPADDGVVGAKVEHQHVSRDARARRRRSRSGGGRSGRRRRGRRRRGDERLCYFVLCGGDRVVLGEVDGNFDRLGAGGREEGLAKGEGDTDEHFLIWFFGKRGSRKREKEREKCK